MPKLCLLVLSLALMTLTALLFLPVHATAAGPAVLLRDINDDPQANTGSAPRQLTPFKGQVAFIATPSNGPAGVWMSDGTDAGTRLIHAGCTAENCNESPAPEILGTVDGFLLFAVPIEDQLFRLRLWRTDGTLDGTEPVAPDDPDLFLDNDPFGARAVATADALYFHACPDTARCGLWKSDGTPAGTTFLALSKGRPVRVGDRIYVPMPRQLLVHDMRTGAGTYVGGWEDFPYNLTAAAGRLFFQATSAARGTEIWTSDGTAAGTRPVSRFSAPSPFSESPWIKEAGGRAYFVAQDGHGFELWRSDGTVPGTRRVTDFAFADALRGLRPEDLAAAGGKILFNAVTGATAAPRLWISDGRPVSTAPFRSLCRPGACGLPVTGSPLVTIGAKVFFPAENGLWSTDGTLPATRRFVTHRCAGCQGQGLFQALQGRILFADRDAAHGAEIWSSNGNAAGTRRLTDMPEGNPLPGPVVAAGGKTFFLGRDAHGEEPWVVDGAGTRLLADISSSAPGAQVSGLKPLGNRIVFSACDGSERAFWTSAGTPETTQPIPGTEISCSVNGFDALVTAGGHLFYTRRGPDFIDQLWSTDGGVPVQLTDFTTPTELGQLNSAASLGGRLFLPVFQGGSSSLWTSDGTPEGTALAFEMPAGVGISNGLRVAGSEALFTSSSSNGYALWRTDGTEAGTRKLADGVSLNAGLARLGSAILFTAYATFPNGSFGDLGLWKTDGTAAGTVKLKALLPGFGPVPEDLVAFQGKVYFFLANSGFWSLWCSDGTTAGTVPVFQLAESLIDEQPPFGLTVFNGRLYFTARDAGPGAHGRELWTSDGTAAGTRMVADLLPGIDSSRPENLRAAGGVLYFTANDGVHGRELWTSDGTAAGTHLLQDIAPEGSSMPFFLTVAGDHLYFVADDGLTGWEVWSLPLP